MCFKYIIITVKLHVVGHLHLIYMIILSIYSLWDLDLGHEEHEECWLTAKPWEQREKCWWTALNASLNKRECHSWHHAIRENWWLLKIIIYSVNSSSLQLEHLVYSDIPVIGCHGNSYNTSLCTMSPVTVYNLAAYLCWGLTKSLCAIYANCTDSL